MKIKIALVQSLSIKLKNAMEAGEMRTVDQLSEELISFTDKEYSLSLSEDYWYQLIEKVRGIDGAFTSDYLMAKQQLKTIISAGIAEMFADISRVIEQAFKTDGIILQLPIEEDYTNV